MGVFRSIGRISLTVGVLGVLAVPGIGRAGPGDTLPNVVALRPSDIQIGQADSALPSAVALRFTTTIANRGAYPFDLVAQPKDPVDPTSTDGVAYQCTGWGLPRMCAERRQVGRIVWDPIHAHYHLDDFARYELRLPSEDGSAPDMGPQGLVAGGNKVTFCMQDTQEDYSFTASANAVPIYQACNQAVQGISSGWADVYDAGLDYQQIILNGVPDGSYFLVIRVNPNGAFLETATTDDVNSVKIALSGNANRVTILG